MASGAAGAFTASNPSDVLIDLILGLKAAYRQNAVFAMNRQTQSVIRKFKSTTGSYLWQPPATPTGRASLMNFPLYDVEDMPDITANSFAIAFGDFNRSYLVVDRAGVTVLIPIPRSLTCCFTPPSAWAAACRTSTRSS